MAAASAGSAVAAEAGAAEAYAAQDDGTTARGSMMPLWVALGAVFAGWLWLLLDDDEDNDEADVPISP